MSCSFLAFYNFCLLTSVPSSKSCPPTLQYTVKKKNPPRQSYPCASFKREEAPVLLSCFSYMDVATESWFSLSQPHFYCDDALKMVSQIRIPPQQTKPSSRRDVNSLCHSHSPSPTPQVLKRHKKSCKGREILPCLIYFHSQILCSSISSHLQLQFCVYRSCALQYTIIK